MTNINQDLSVPLSNDALGIGKASEKLLDVIQKGIGKFYDQTLGTHLEPRRIKIISAAKAEAEHGEVIKRTEALLNADKLAQRAGKRLLVREIRRQNNIEVVISLAKNKLDEDVSDEPVDADWATRFFDVVQDVSDANVQTLWAKILAGEIKQPGTFSLRTIEILRNINSQEAQIFSNKLCPLIFSSQFAIRLERKTEIPKFGLRFVDIIRLRDAGLVSEGDNIVNSHEDEFGERVEFQIGLDKFKLYANNKLIEIPILLLSTAGQELIKIQEYSVNREYIEEAKEFLLKIGFVKTKKEVSP